MRRMRRIVRRHNVHTWADGFLAALRDTGPALGSTEGVPFRHDDHGARRMNREGGAGRPLDDDALAVLGVLSRGYRKMSVDDVADAHVFNRVSTDRVA